MLQRSQQQGQGQAEGAPVVQQGGEAQGEAPRRRRQGRRGRLLQAANMQAKMQASAQAEIQASAQGRSVSREQGGGDKARGRSASSGPSGRGRSSEANGTEQQEEEEGEQREEEPSRELTAQQVGGLSGHA